MFSVCDEKIYQKYNCYFPNVIWEIIQEFAQTNFTLFFGGGHVFLHAGVFYKIHNFRMYKLHQNSWIHTRNLPSVIPSWANIIYGNGKLYLSGGILNECVLGRVYEHDINKNTTIKLEPMSHARYCHVTIIIDDYLFVIGGNEFQKMEKYNMKTKQWTFCQSLHFQIYDCFGFANKLYLLGEQKFYVYNILKDCYDQPIPFPHFANSITKGISRDNLFVGFASSKCNSYVIFDFISHRWEQRFFNQEYQIHRAVFV